MSTVEHIRHRLSPLITKLYFRCKQTNMSSQSSRARGSGEENNTQETLLHPTYTSIAFDKIKIDEIRELLNNKIVDLLIVTAIQLD